MAKASIALIVQNEFEPISRIAMLKQRGMTPDDLLLRIGQLTVSQSTKLPRGLVTVWK